MAVVPLFRIDVLGGDQFRRLALRMKDAGRKDLITALRKEFRVAARPVVADVQARYRALPNVAPAHRMGPQARASVAGAVRLQVTAGVQRAGVRVLVDSKKMPADMRALPKVWEKGTWRHPVFANPNRSREDWSWVVQEVTPKGTFRRAMRAHASDFQAACLRAMDEIVRELS